jgi:membrane protein
MVFQIQHRKISLQKTKSSLLKIPLVKVIAGTIQESGKHDVGQRAAGVAYYAIISIFPLLLGLIAVFGFFLPSINVQNSLLNFVGNNLPDASNILKENIDGIIRLRGVMSVVSIIILFWGASALFGSISLAINRAWNIHKNRHLFIRKASEIGMVFGTGILFLLSLGTSAFITFLGNSLNLPDRNTALVYISAKLIAFLLMLAIFLLLYKFVPNIKTRWRDIWPGALLAAIFFEIARALFIFYLEHFANYQVIYGTVSSIVILMVWIYYSAFILILGAEFTFQYSQSRNSVTVDSSTDE